MIKITKKWYNDNYSKNKLSAQRLYPNEELLRFMGRNFFQFEISKRNNIRILEVGCGSCSNLWMIAREGFDAYGIDLSEEGIKLGYKMLEHWNTSAYLLAGSITSLPYKTNSFDAVVDVFSTYCLKLEELLIFFVELYRILKPNGKFFMYTPSTESIAFNNYAPAVKIDQFTLNGIYREDSPYFGNFYPFRFADINHISLIMEDNGFQINYKELLNRSYNSMKENFQFLVLEATKIK